MRRARSWSIGSVGPIGFIEIVLLCVVLVALTIGCGTGGGGGGSGFGAAQQLDTTVVRVVDGDTIVVALPDGDGKDEKVRLIGIDTPETKKPNTPVECYGPEASARLHDLLPEGTAVTLERDAEERDIYGRLLAYVHRDGDGMFVNETMVTDGFASTLTIAPNVAHVDALAAQADAARRARRGLWGACRSAHSAQSP